MSASTGSISNELNNAYRQLSSGKRINSAADDAAGLAISEKMAAQARGISQATTNAQDMKNLLRTAEGGLNNIADALNRIRELGVQAANDTYSASDREIIQFEIDQLKGFIQDAAKGTEFNRMKLLDGTFVDKQAQVGANSGQAIQINLSNATLDILGIANFDVTGGVNSIDFDAIDGALDMVNAARARIGASENRLEYTINANETSYLNQMQAMSRIADADMGKALIQKSRAEVLQQYQIFSQKEQMQRTGMTLSLLR